VADDCVLALPANALQEIRSRQLGKCSDPDAYRVALIDRSGK
jgi:hypothetical protein